MKKYLFLLIIPILLFIPKDSFAQSISATGVWGGYLSSFGTNQSDSSDHIHISTEWVGSYDINTSSPYIDMPKRSIYSTSTAGILKYYKRTYYISEFRTFAFANYKQGNYYTLNFEYNVGSYVQVDDSVIKNHFKVHMYDGSDYTIDVPNASIDCSFNNTSKVGKISVVFLAPTSGSHLRIMFGDYTYNYNSSNPSIFAMNGQDTYNQGFRVYLISVEETQDLNNALLSQITIQNQTMINQNQQIIDNSNKTNQNLEDIESSITSEEAPNLDALEDSAGWLPPGPVDSILNLPLSLFNNLSSALSNTCQPVQATLPFINTSITLPCISSLYEQIGIQSFLNWVGVVVGCIILYNYFIALYKWVDDTLTFRENTMPDWGGV